MKKIIRSMSVLVAFLAIGTISVFAKPAASAPSPTVDSASVLSIFSDTYPAVSEIGYEEWWNCTWSDSIVAAGDTVKHLVTEWGGVGGMVFADLDVSAMTTLHIDVYPVVLGSTLKYTVATATANSGWTAFPTLTLNQWNSVNIPISALNLDGASVIQVGFGTPDANGDIVFLDNIYFYDNSAVVDTEAPTAFTATKGKLASDAIELLLTATDNSGGVNYEITYGTTTVNVGGVSGVQKSHTISGLQDDTEYSFSVVAKDATGNEAANSPIVVVARTAVAVPAAPIPAPIEANVISVYSDTYTNIASNRLDWWATSFSAVSNEGNEMTFTTSDCCFGFDLTDKPIDVSSMLKLHVDIYPTTLASMTFGVTDGADRNKHITLTANQWNSIDVTLSELNADLSNIESVGFWNLHGEFYFDNIYFYTDTPTKLSDLSDKELVSVYPNPVKDQITISSASEISQVIVRNIVGQTVKSLMVNGLEKIIDLNDLTAGNYFVTVQLNDGELSTHKIVKL